MVPQKQKEIRIMRAREIEISRNMYIYRGRDSDRKTAQTDEQRDRQLEDKRTDANG